MTATAAEISALEKVLWVVAPPGRKMLAPKLAAAGLRVHPELATKRLVSMGTEADGNWAPQRAEKIDITAPDPPMDVQQAGALSIALLVLPPPLPVALAPELYALGVRAHPELDEAGQGLLARANVVGLIRKLENRAPKLSGLADRIQSATDAAASGDMSKVRALAAELAPPIRADSQAMKQTAAAIKPEDFATEDDS
ncbi:hypothetical protein [Mycolicibacterium fluoranthenivorans]|uniref:Uncharacterized protein n=1 Tax=Mycolicibacterium fluoranthenivorans TaxID=258505 RepID=A0A7X5ZG56_9MYCO|nr:hypothetical protein [Mycolicibacterium fluoranthenivorans]MCV7354504.1 hypothetical protein [Mycolicibacterium fluoranthenivorans]NIH98890.1 hypothetical protein [Mycolicibacterium fluoranthenivorans]